MFSAQWDFNLHFVEAPVCGLQNHTVILVVVCWWMDLYSWGCPILANYLLFNPLTCWVIPHLSLNSIWLDTIIPHIHDILTIVHYSLYAKHFSRWPNVNRLTPERGLMLPVEVQPQVLELCDELNLEVVSTKS